MAEKFKAKGVIFAKVDAEVLTDAAEENEVNNLPCFKFFYKGEVNHTYLGANPSALEDAIKVGHSISCLV